MINVENGVCHIKTSKGIPGLTGRWSLVLQRMRNLNGKR